MGICHQLHWDVLLSLDWLSKVPSDHRRTLLIKNEQKGIWYQVNSKT